MNRQHRIDFVDRTRIMGILEEMEAEAIDAGYTGDGGFRRAIRIAKERIRTAGDEWRDDTETVPVGEKVMIVTMWGRVKTGHRNADGSWCYDMRGEYKPSAAPVPDPVYWMPLPEGPGADT